MIPKSSQCTRIGLSCYNRDQYDGICRNYEIQFLCLRGRYLHCSSFVVIYFKNDGQFCVSLVDMPLLIIRAYISHICTKNLAVLHQHQKSKA